MSERRVTGPIQVFVIGFDGFEASGEILAELKRVRKRGVIRVVDLLFVQKDAKGGVKSSMHLTDLSEGEREPLGAIAGAIMGLEAGGAEGAVFGAELGVLAVAERDAGMSIDELGELADAIPPGSAGAILVIEHHWAADLRDAIIAAGGRTLMQAMISPNAMALVGEELRAQLELEAAIEAVEAIKMGLAVEVAQTLAAAELIENIAILHAADVVATALAVEDAATAEALAALIEAGIVEEAAQAEAEAVVAAALAVEDAAIEDAAETVAAAEEIKRLAVLDVVRALLAAEVIEEAAAEEAIQALVDAEIIEEAAAEAAIEAVRNA